jgi:hypothetical protein
MLSIGKLVVGQQRYYEQQVALEATTTTTPDEARHRANGLALGRGRSACTAGSAASSSTP